MPAHNAPSAEAMEAARECCLAIENIRGRTVIGDLCIERVAMTLDAFASRASKGEGERPVADETVVLLAGRGASFAVGRLGVEINRARDIVDEAVREVLADYRLTAPARATRQETPVSRAESVGGSIPVEAGGVGGVSSPAPSPGACPTKCPTCGAYYPKLRWSDEIMFGGETWDGAHECLDPWHHPAPSSSGVPREVEDAINEYFRAIQKYDASPYSACPAGAWMVTCGKALRESITRALAEARAREAFTEAALAWIASARQPSSDPMRPGGDIAHNMKAEAMHRAYEALIAPAPARETRGETVGTREEQAPAVLPPQAVKPTVSSPSLAPSPGACPTPVDATSLYPVAPVVADVHCVCGTTRNCAETWWLVERREIQPPLWLKYTGANPPTWTTDAWKAQRFSRKLDAIHEAESVALCCNDSRIEAIEHGFSGGERVLAETRCPSCGSEWLRALPEMPSHPAPSSVVVKAHGGTALAPAPSIGVAPAPSSAGVTREGLIAAEDIEKGTPVFVGGDGRVYIDQCWTCSAYRGSPHGHDTTGAKCDQTWDTPAAGAPEEGKK